MSNDATHDDEANRVKVLLHTVKIQLCELCLRGVGEECHTPECALWLHDSPGIPIHPELYEVLSTEVSQ